MDIRLCLFLICIIYIIHAYIDVLAGVGICKQLLQKKVLNKVKFSSTKIKYGLECTVIPPRERDGTGQTRRTDLLTPL